MFCWIMGAHRTTQEEMITSLNTMPRVPPSEESEADDFRSVRVSRGSPREFTSFFSARTDADTSGPFLSSSACAGGILRGEEAYCTAWYA